MTGSYARHLAGFVSYLRSPFFNLAIFRIPHSSILPFFNPAISILPFSTLRFVVLCLRFNFIGKTRTTCVTIVIKTALNSSSLHA